MYLSICVLQDLIPVKFTPIADRDEKTSLIAKGVGCVVDLYLHVEHT